MSFSRATCILLLAGTTTAAIAEPARSLNDLTGPWQLFIDDHLVASREGVNRVYHAFEKHPGNPIMVASKPWEAGVVVCNAVLPTEDGTGWRMWYYSWAPKDDPKRSYSCYATSTDGLTWEKPNLGLVPYRPADPANATDQTNFIEAGGDVFHTPADPDPARRYKSFGGGGKGYHASASPDGIRWAKLTQDFIVQGGDVGTFLFEPRTEKVHAYVKVNAKVSGLRRRAVGYSQGSGYDHWPALRLVMAPDDVDDRWVKPGEIHRTHMYGCPMQAYETMYLGLLWVFRADDEDGYFLGPVFSELVSSRDAVHWRRQDGDRPPLLNVGPPGSWDSGMVYAQSIVRRGDRLWLYYTAASNLHDSPPFHGEIGVATLRKDGFASMDAAYKPGTLTTTALAGMSGPLKLNYRAWGGSIRVAVLDAAGTAIPGYAAEDCTPLTGDAIEAAVAWKAHAELPSGNAPLRLRFHIDKGSLFSFAAGDEVRVAEQSAEPALAVLYTFEGDKGRQISDKLTADGSAPGKMLGRGKIDADEQNAAFGKQSLMVSSPWRPLQRVELPGTAKLGKGFTLAMMARSEDNRPARLFSAYNGNRPINCSELVLDLDPRGRDWALRFTCKGIAVQSQAVDLSDGKYHHLAVTYDDGRVLFYADGKPAGEEWLPGGAGVELARNLLIGEDAELGSDEQFTGRMDDVLVLSRVLAPTDIARLAAEGAEAVLLK